jgi:peptidoglycan/xylan/chitin deacetylase (PgdA/CDA1 family)
LTIRDRRSADDGLRPTDDERIAMKNTTIKNAAAVVLQGLGLHRIMRRLNRNKVTFLLYHGVVRDDEAPLPPWMLREHQFRWQMAYLAKHYHVLPLSDVVEHLVAGRPLPERSVVITFDDGFRNNYTIAYPILKEFGLPATVFLVTGYLDSEQALWPDVLFQAIHRTRVDFLDLRDLGDGAHPLRTEHERHAAFGGLVEYLKTLPVEEKRRRLDEIAGRLKLDLGQLPDREDAPFALLRRSEIERMVREKLVTFGVHTNTHEVLTRLSFEEARREIRISKQRVEELLGEPARFFAYPNGTAADFNEALKREVQRQGFACAFASRGGLVNSRFDLFALTRVGIGPGLNGAYFKLKLAGVVDVLERISNSFLRSARSAGNSKTVIQNPRQAQGL